MLILGISGGLDRLRENIFNFSRGAFHDSAAALLADNKVVAAIEEERLNRIKHSNKFCSSAIKHCLDTAKIKLSEIDYIAFYSSEKNFDNLLRDMHLNKPFSKNTLSIRERLCFLLESEFHEKIPLNKFIFVSHHLCHAASTYYLSGFNESLVVTVDGHGEEVSLMVLESKDNKMEPLRTLYRDCSLGSLYARVIRFLGFSEFEEYKVMGLAPYGDPVVYRDLFNKFYRLIENGTYELYKDKIMELYDILVPRLKDEPFEKVHYDIAAALQETLEIIMLHLLTYFQQKTGNKHLCLAGGVAQNSSMNGKILQSNLFEDIFVQPASNDSGCALGAALYIMYQQQPKMQQNALSHVYWGTPLPNKQILESQIKSWGNILHFQQLSDPSLQVARLLANKSVIGWVQGASEFGPRALGNRSILGDPRPASHKDLINSMIKKRENYRPFAPSVLEENVSEYFEVPAYKKNLDYMSFVVPVKVDKRNLLGAVTHVDGTARIQTVNRKTNLKYWELINAFKEITGVPILLNTSFNNNAEPIVDSAYDAIVCFLTSGLNYLVIDDFLIEKNNSISLAELTLSLPEFAELYRINKFLSYEKNSCRCEIYEIRFNYEIDVFYPISYELYLLLCASDASRSIMKQLQHCNLDMQKMNLLQNEIMSLWIKRAVILKPVNS